MKNESATRITEAELEVLKVLWQADEALPVTALRSALKTSRGWEPTTVKTLVARLAAKGALRQEKRDVYYYSPVMTRQEYESWAARDLVRRLFNGHAGALMSALARGEGLSRADIDDLRRLLDEGENQ